MPSNSEGWRTDPTKIPAIPYFAGLAFSSSTVGLTETRGSTVISPLTVTVVFAPKASTPITPRAPPSPIVISTSPGTEPVLGPSDELYLKPMPDTAVIAAFGR